MSELNVCEAILARRSVRAYTSEKVEAKKIRSLIEAAVRAPTDMHLEPWAFAIIQDKVMLKELSDIAKQKLTNKLKKQLHLNDTLNQPSYDVFYDANTMIVICANTETPNAVADCWMAAQNLMLAAHAIGLGSCVITQALPALNDKNMKSRLGITGNYEAIAPIVIGYSNKESQASMRKRPIILTWLETESEH
jgi:nitroreductase